MYRAETTITRIQSLIKSKGLTQKQVFANSGIGEDTVKRMTDNKGISSFSLARIADELDCSTDYLLGRTDNPIIYNQNNNSGFISTGNNSKQTSNESGIVFQGNISGRPTINLSQPESTRSQLQNVIDHLLSEIEELKKIQKDVGF